MIIHNILLGFIFFKSGFKLLFMFIFGRREGSRKRSRIKIRGRRREGGRRRREGRRKVGGRRME